MNGLELAAGCAIEYWRANGRKGGLDGLRGMCTSYAGWMFKPDDVYKVAVEVKMTDWDRSQVGIAARDAAGE